MLDYDSDIVNSSGNINDGLFHFVLYNPRNWQSWWWLTTESLPRNTDAIESRITSRIGFPLELSRRLSNVSYKLNISIKILLEVILMSQYLELDEYKCSL